MTRKKPKTKQSEQERERKRAYQKSMKNSLRVNHSADLTAMAFVCLIRERVKELATALGRLDYLSGHPDETGGRVMLEDRINTRELCTLIASIATAEQACSNLLDDNLLLRFCTVPDLAGACRTAAVATGLSKATADKP